MVPLLPVLLSLQPPHPKYLLLRDLLLQNLLLHLHLQGLLIQYMPQTLQQHVLCAPAGRILLADIAAGCPADHPPAAAIALHVVFAAAVTAPVGGAASCLCA
jgi:hypothetical protein